MFQECAVCIGLTPPEAIFIVVVLFHLFNAGAGGSIGKVFTMQV